MGCNIAIDGPAGAGKSTIAKKVAKELSFIYVDTGAMYRAMALYLLNHGVNGENQEEIEAVCSGADISIEYKNGEQIVILNGENVNAMIRTEQVGNMASKSSANPKVRAHLLKLQRTLAEKNDVVMDGRDIGTVVLPDAQVKIFLTASPEARAERRYKELVEKGMDVKYDDILNDVITRDYNDTHRKTAPLKPAEGCITVDTTELDFEQSVRKNNFRYKGEYLMGQSKALYAVGRAVCKPVFKLLYRYKTIIEEPLPLVGGMIIASNHISNSDPVLLGLSQKKRRLFFMDKKLNFLKNKFFGALIRALGAFPVERGAGDGKAIKTGEDLIRDGEIMTIFIEGGRSKQANLCVPAADALLLHSRCRFLLCLPASQL